MTRRGGMLAGLSAAVLFGASAPLAKRLLPEASPLMLASLLYLGAAAGLTVALALLGRRGEARLGRRDVPLLLAITVLGGIIGPVLMLIGLGRLSGLAGALLLNLEAPATMLVALTLFREHLGRLEALAAGLIVAGAALVAWRPGQLGGDALGALAMLGACVAWALDNNLSQKLSVRDPLAVARAKCGLAGLTTLGLALALGDRLPRQGIVAAAAGVGVICYGVSLALDMLALRALGAAREAALFATAPFAGALLAYPLLGERPGAFDAGAGALMALGVLLLARARHEHAHTHEILEHEHVHTHDDHHQHSHDGPVTEPHSHAHRHEPVTHRHTHVSDVHHRHTHH